MKSPIMKNIIPTIIMGNNNLINAKKLLRMVEEEQNINTLGTRRVEIKERPADRNKEDIVFILINFLKIIMEIINIISAKRIIPYINNISLIIIPPLPIFSIL